MLNKLKRLGRRLRASTSGNATMLVALGMPALIGGTGLAVDVSQWYMWKRELQYAVDQAAIAGAWARATEGMAANYQTRALQEYNANVSMIGDIDSTPTVGLSNWAGGNNNSVTVSATATQPLPFSSFLTGDATTVYAYAQASFEQGSTFTSCIIAVDEDEDGAITIGGSSVLTAGCGMAALSDSEDAVVVTGNPDIDTGWVLARGGIDNWFDTHTDDEIHENMEGLYDPFADLTPPEPTESLVNRTYGCVQGGTTTRADVATQSTITYSYWRGANTNSVTPYNYPNPRQGTTTNDNQTNVLVGNGTVAGSTTTSSTTWTQLSGSGANRIWEKKVTSNNTTYANVVVNTTPTQASLLPGTYTDIHVSCTTTFSSGVYIIDGGGLEIHGQYNVTGSGVMFVLKNGAYIIINGGSNINLTAIQASDLMARGIAQTQANQLANMLVFEDRESEGSDRNSINGNATTVLNGTVYLPVSNLTFSGTASVSSGCLMLAAATITITGDANMTRFCEDDSEEDTTVATTAGTVKLVA